MIDQEDGCRTFRHSVYALLILSSLTTMTARVLSAQSRDGHTPFFSANDRSRWSTISALVDDGTYSIDRVRKRPGWQSIDMVQHRGRDGELHFYSSKPPLYPTLLAGEYWLIRQLTNATFEHFPFGVARTMLIITNILPMGLFLILTAMLAEHLGETDFGRVFLVAAAAWGTFLTTFASTLNNHTPAAISVLVATLCVARIWQQRDESELDANQSRPSAWLFIVAGVAGGFAAANDLPALSFTTLLSLTVWWLFPRPTLVWFVPALLFVAIAFFVTNYIAHDSWLPPYAHRQPGDNWYNFPGSYWYGSRKGVDLGEPSQMKYLFHMLVGHHGFFSLTPIWLLSLAGILMALRNSDPRWRLLAAVTLLLFIVCVTYYTGFRPQRDRNFGGVTSGFRWLFWQIPLWLLMLVPVADWLSETQRRKAFGLLLLAVSTLSAAIPAANPWSHPWIYQIGQ